jgi:Tol biopolymer transport system component
MSIDPGARLGPYDVTAPLGAGGMGEVYRARDSRLNRDVAIKVLPPAFATDPLRMARFAREAQVLAALSHPNIAAIYGLEESGGATALIMELVEGSTLAERIAAGPIPLDEALAIARQIGAALESAHEKGIIHRDLKPANIKITPEGKVKVLDFGLAKAMDADPASSGSPANSPTLTLESTRVGQIMGTAAYMSPEQARGKPVDKRADIWAFGVVLFEMLSGHSIFEGETVSDTLAAVLRADLEWKRLPADTPPKVRRLLQRCLERDPKRRLRDIGDAWIELETPDEPAAPTVLPAAPPQPAWRRVLPWAAAVVIGGAGIAWGLLHTAAPPPRPVVRWASPEKGFAAFVAVSHDGTRLAYTMGSLNDLHLGIRMLDQFEGKTIEGTEGGFFPIFSPDGQWILYSTIQNKIKKMPVTGGASITLCDGTTAQGADWGDDDTIVVAGPKGLMRVSAGGGTPETLTTVDSAKGETAHMHPQILPGARKIVFTVANGTSFDAAKVGIFDVKTKSYSVFASGGARARYVPTGHLVYYRGGTLFALPFDIKRGAAVGSEAPVVEGVSSVGPLGYADYSFSDGGLLLYVAGSSAQQGTTLVWADRKGETQPVAATPQLWGTGRLSPDGMRIANGLQKGAGERDIWVYDIARGTTTRLSFEGGSDNPIWSPDGRRIVFGQGRGNLGLYSVAADGSAKPELLLPTANVPVPTSFTPDGKTLVYTLRGADSKTHLMVFTPGSQPRALHDSPFGEAGGQISPDGKWLAYESSESGSSEVYVQPFPGPGAKVRISVQGGFWPRWARSGRELFFWESVQPTTRVFSAEIQTARGFSAGTPQPLFSMASGTTWDVAPDGKRFLVELTPLGPSGTSRMNGVMEWFDELRRRAPAKK